MTSAAGLLLAVSLASVLNSAVDNAQAITVRQLAPSGLASPRNNNNLLGMTQQANQPAQGMMPNQNGGLMQQPGNMFGWQGNMNGQQGMGLPNGYFGQQAQFGRFMPQMFGQQGMMPQNGQSNQLLPFGQNANQLVPFGQQGQQMSQPGQFGMQSSLFPNQMGAPFMNGQSGLPQNFFGSQQSFARNQPGFMPNSNQGPPMFNMG